MANAPDDILWRAAEWVGWAVCAVVSMIASMLYRTVRSDRKLLYDMRRSVSALERVHHADKRGEVTGCAPFARHMEELAQFRERFNLAEKRLDKLEKNDEEMLRALYEIRGDVKYLRKQSD